MVSNFRPTRCFFYTVQSFVSFAQTNINDFNYFIPCKDVCRNLCNVNFIKTRASCCSTCLKVNLNPCFHCYIIWLLNENSENYCYLCHDDDECPDEIDTSINQRPSV